jgi:isopenicillin N synthase-like dioxygenase
LPTACAAQAAWHINCLNLAVASVFDGLLKRRLPVAAGLPIIDISGLSSTFKQHRLRVAKDMQYACRHTGFFYICQHGISSALQQAVLMHSQRFFALSDAEKLHIHKQRSIANRGYEPLRNQTLEAGAPADLKEGFYAGREYALDSPEVQQKRFNCGPNQWPQQLPEFQVVMLAYQAQLEGLARTLMRGLALSLDLAEQYFEPFCQDAMLTLRLLHYPPQPAHPLPNEKGCGAHTDFGALTLLLQDQQGGLQVWDAQRQHWLDAPPIADSYVINIGDLIARWTNNRYKSTLHRVINQSGQQRYSVPFFFGGNPNYRVECLASCKAPGEHALYPATTVEQHHIEMYQKTYG